LQRREVLINLFQAITLGVLQGITEFLPISSDGHLVILGKLLGTSGPDNSFDVLLHLGTLCSICFVFFGDIVGVCKTLAKPETRSLIRGIMVASIPTAIIGLSLKGFVELSARSYIFVGFSLWVTGVLLFLTRSRRTSEAGRFTLWHAAAIGIAQGIAVLPGVSRSGSTLAIAILLGVNREFAGRFSFLIAIPAIAGAVAVKIPDFGQFASEQWGIMACATVVSGVVGVFSLKILLKMILKGSIYKFAYYCLVVGAISIVLEFI
jgi:undecaprenyl-diphosphatase